ncbi:MAG: carbohydrate binding family 9 domain-containing protein [Gemmatimonadota bacterium]|nr:carbohydrate binding family 9 domain-containing protein [Gemmatimonadota bacterium]
MFLIPLAFALQQTAAPTPGRPAAEPPSVTAVRASRAPAIDGKLAEEDWQRAPAVTDLVQLYPKEGEAASERTEVRVLYDDVAIYVGARMFERDPDKIRAELSRRDDFTPSDLFGVALDTYHDHQTSMLFIVNPLGVRFDQLTSNDQGDGDSSWDPVWEVATSIDGDGWTAELRIPLSQLRFAPRAEQVWGVLFVRDMSSRNERVAFPLLRQSENGFASRFAHLVGIRGVPTPKRVELLPYARTQVESRRATPGDPFFAGREANYAAGLDFKYGLTSNVTVDATVNPDFGQVEADPAELNLSVFETFFEERRPFFVEGAQIFAFGRAGGFSIGPGTVFYSRRIGRAPTLAPSLSRARAAGDSVVGPFTDVPKSASILGAAKVSGKLARGTSIGFLHAETGRVMGTVDAEQLFGRRAADGTLAVERREHVRYRDELEPRGHYSVGRLRQDLRNGQTTVGAIYTQVLRDLQTPRLDSLFRRTAQAAGVDWQHRWAENRFNLTGYAVWSSIRGSPTAIAAAQRSSARYYQRPDQDYARYDSTRASLDGATATTKLRYDGRNGFGFGVQGNVTTPGYELNDVGFLTRADTRGIFASANWGTPKPTRRFRRVAVEGGYSSEWNSGGDRTGVGGNLNLVAILQNNWGGFVSVGARGRSLSPFATRGGPLIVSSPGRSVSFNLWSDERQKVSGSAYVFLFRSDVGTRSNDGGVFVTWRPVHNTSFSVGPSYSDQREMGHLVTKVADTLATATFGTRYVFGTLSQRTLSMRVRTNVTFTPALSLQLYAEPFTSGAAVSSLRELLRPRSFDFEYYERAPDASVTRDASGNYTVVLARSGQEVTRFTVSNPDQSFRSLRGSGVLRWEYRPGATFFAVWTHNRGRFETGGSYRGLSDLGSLLQLPPENVFLLKVNYWFSR